jgi:hypothetical protein
MKAQVGSMNSARRADAAHIHEGQQNQNAEA